MQRRVITPGAAGHTGRAHALFSSSPHPQSRIDRHVEVPVRPDCGGQELINGNRRDGRRILQIGKVRNPAVAARLFR
jgi:hypothetical protein